MPNSSDAQPHHGMKKDIAFTAYTGCRDASSHSLGAKCRTGDDGQVEKMRGEGRNGLIAFCLGLRRG